MKFNIKMDDKVIHEAAALVEKHYIDSGFLRRIGEIQKFSYTVKKGFDVVSSLQASSVVMTIAPYKTKWPWSKVIGYASGNTIYVNTRKLDLPLKDRVQNLFHEPCHLLGYRHSRDNKVSKLNDESVPYKVAAIFVKYLESIGKL
jgi:hypothetical protein